MHTCLANLSQELLDRDPRLPQTLPGPLLDCLRELFGHQQGCYLVINRKVFWSPTGKPFGHQQKNAIFDKCEFSSPRSPKPLPSPSPLPRPRPNEESLWLVGFNIRIEDSGNSITNSQTSMYNSSSQNISFIWTIT